MIPLTWLRALGHQRWIRFGLRDRLLRRLASPETMGGISFECDFFGWRYKGDLGNFVEWNIFFYGAYELGLLRLLARAADLGGEEAVFWDVGANVGQHSLFMARHAAQIHAFEPWPTAQIRCRTLLADNHISHVTLHDFGLGDSDQELDFFAPASENMGTGSFCADCNDNQYAGRLRVRRGDDVAAELKLDRLDVVKIDAEGFEPRILAGMQETLRRLGPVVVAEIGLDVHGITDLASLFPMGWHLMAASSHPEDDKIVPLEVEGRRMVTVIAAPPDKFSRLLAS